MKRSLIILFAAMVTAYADGPKDNQEGPVRPVPPLGIEVPEDVRKQLGSGLEALRSDLDTTRALFTAAKQTAQLALLPDVEIYHRAVHDALAYGEFYKPAEFKTAVALLEQGSDRLAQLRQGEPSWTSAQGLVARGYESKIDGSVQPYGLVVPQSYSPNSAHKFRLDCWFHGRGEKLTELDFIRQRQTSPGQFTPQDAIVLHLYGRYCNANKLAGEIDLLEALDSVKERYRIDDDRIVVRGFSMGGAACWQFAVHYAERWAAAAPGAGFSETPDFLKVFQKETLMPTWYEKKLWHLYDCTDWAINLYHCPTVAYSGEVDRQKQAADVMAAALEKENIHLAHLIGPGMGHKYHPDTKQEIDRRIDALAGLGRDRAPKTIHFTTWTLRYPSMHWLTVDGLEEHWERARVDAEIKANANSIVLTTSNVTAFTVTLPPGQRHFDIRQAVRLEINGHQTAPQHVQSDGSFRVRVQKQGQSWAIGEPQANTLTKRHGLQGPIDDAFMDSFMMVRPTGQAFHERTENWVDSELTHAMDHWRKQFRGHARIKNDSDIDDADIAAHNLILWGDPSSNAILKRIADKLPIVWGKERVQVGTKTYGASSHIPTLIFPNPLNPSKYVVLNSGFTFREYDYLNNARQVPKLPDWAIIDISQPITSRRPGGISDAGFFDEHWQLNSPSQ